MEQSYQRIRDQGLGLAAISYDSVAILKQFASRAHITYPLLSDPDSAVIRRFGILNTTLPKDSIAFGVPYPGTYVLDRSGVVIAKYFQADFRERDTAGSILLRQFGLKPPEEEAIQAKHAEVRPWASGEQLHPGQRVTLSLDVTLPRRVHVYAPGAQGYIPVALSVAGSRAIRPESPVYPPSKTIRLEAIHESAPVYEGRFRVMQTVTLGQAEEVEPLLDNDWNLSIGGKFSYQACDDRQCFPPESVPVKWTLKIMPFDRTRAPAAIQHKAAQ